MLPAAAGSPRPSHREIAEVHTVSSLNESLNRTRVIRILIQKVKFRYKPNVTRRSHPTLAPNPDLSVSFVCSKTAKLPQSTQTPELVSHTLAAKSPQGRGGDEAECILVAGEA